MKRLLTMAIIVLLVPSLTMAQAQEKKAPAKGNETVEQTLTRMEREWATAYIKKTGQQWTESWRMTMWQYLGAGIRQRRSL